MDFLYDLGLFLAEAVSIVVLLLLFVLALVAIGQRQKGGHDGHIEIRDLNDRYQQVGESLEGSLVDADTAKRLRKERRKAEKAEAKARKKQAAKKEGDSGERAKPVTFVLNFKGDLRASAVENLREEVTALLPQLKPGDDVVVRLESPGGLVHGYGLAASQLRRIRDAGAALTVCVDKVAASGGYMMACVADRIVAAPFAVIGSIGVVAQLPNFHRLLKKHDVDFEVLTAGEYKRTLTLFGENTEKGRKKFIEDLEETHDLFKAFVHDNRPGLDVDKVATGEIWYGQRALDEGLIDAVETSDSLLLGLKDARRLVEVRYIQKRSWQEKLGKAGEAALERVFYRIWQAGQSRLPH